MTSPPKYPFDCGIDPASPFCAEEQRVRVKSSYDRVHVVNLGRTPAYNRAEVAIAAFKNQCLVDLGESRRMEAASDIDYFGRDKTKNKYFGFFTGKIIPFYTNKSPGARLTNATGFYHSIINEEFEAHNKTKLKILSQAEEVAIEATDYYFEDNLTIWYECLLGSNFLHSPKKIKWVRFQSSSDRVSPGETLPLVNKYKLTLDSKNTIPFMGNSLILPFPSKIYYCDGL